MLGCYHIEGSRLERKKQVNNLEQWLTNVEMIIYALVVYFALQIVLNKDKTMKEVLMLLLTAMSDILKKCLAEHFKEELRKL